MPGAHKIGAAVSGPRIAGGKIMGMRTFLILRDFKGSPTESWGPRRHPRDDREILLDRLSQGWWSQALGLEDQSQWFAQHRDALRNATEELRGDREVVMTAVCRDGRLLEYATEERRSDQEMVMKAVSNNGSSLQFATEELRGHREIVMKAVSNNGFSLRFATEELRGDREIVMKAVSNNGFSLRFATEELRGDREIVKTAVSKDGFSLESATEELRGDRDIMEVALKQVANRYRSGDVVALKVTLLSGRCCTQICHKAHNMQRVLTDSARFAGLGSSPREDNWHPPAGSENLLDWS